jgi:phosphate uptake regulator
MSELPSILEELERETLGELHEVVRLLDRALDAVICQDHELAAAVIAAEDAVDRRCACIHGRILSALPVRTAPADLQMLAALLHIVRGAQGIAARGTRVANLVTASACMTSELAALLKLIEGAMTCAISGVWLAREAFATRDIELSHEVARAAEELKRRTEMIFRRVLVQHQSDEHRTPTMTVFLLLSYAGGVSDIALDIAEQTVIVVEGMFREVADVGPLTGGTLAASAP